MPEHVFEEEGARDALSHRPTLQVGEGHDDRVDVAGLDLAGQRLECEHQSTVAQGTPTVQPYSGVT